MQHFSPPRQTAQPTSRRPTRTGTRRRRRRTWTSSWGFIGDDAYMCDLSGKWMHGKDAIRADWTKPLADPAFKLSWTVDSAEVSKDGNMGYTRGSFQGGQGNDTFSGSYATIWKKDKDGKWRVAVDIASAEPPQK